MHLPSEPDSRDLLPRLLACLPTSCFSPRPPPALLPLLSPLLRQRINYLSTDSTSRGQGWLPLLSWDPERASKLPAVVERMELEPHPVSGELEVEDVRPAKYRKLDEETLQASLEVDQFGLRPIYVWCENDEHGETGPGWKLTELRSLEDVDLDEEEEAWYDSQLAALDAAAAKPREVPQTNGQTNGHHSSSTAPQTRNNGDQDDEDDPDYWASYDRTPGRTPAPKHSPAPVSSARQQQSNRQRSQSELDYYARYGNEVQPALDAHDPDEETTVNLAGQSTLNGNSLFTPIPPRPDSKPNAQSMFPADDRHDQDEHAPLTKVVSPRPISPTSSHSSVERLEERAAMMSDTGRREDDDGEGPQRDDAGQVAVQQHISTNMKSMFRLARSVGMERVEFERVVRTELGVLSMLERDG